MLFRWSKHKMRLQQFEALKLYLVLSVLSDYDVACYSDMHTLDWLHESNIFFLLHRMKKNFSSNFIHNFGIQLCERKR